MKAKKGSQSCVDITIDSGLKLNTVEIEFHYQDFTQIKRKIAIPHGQFSPPTVLHDHHANQWFLWDRLRGTYHEVSGDTLSKIEVVK